MATRRYTTRLRFEAGQEIPPEGASWNTRTAIGLAPVRITLLEIKRVFPHPSEPGVMLMDARIRRRDA